MYTVIVINILYTVHSTVVLHVVCDGCVIDKAVDISDVYASLPASVNCVSDVVGNSSCPSDTARGVVCSVGVRCSIRSA